MHTLKAGIKLIFIFISTLVGVLLFAKTKSSTVQISLIITSIVAFSYKLTTSKSNNYLHALIVDTVIFFTISAISASYQCYRHEKLNIPPKGTNVEVVAKAIEWKKRMNNWDSMTVEVNSLKSHDNQLKIKMPQKMIVSSRGILSKFDIRPGDELTFTSRIFPAWGARNIGDPNWRQYFGVKSIAARLRLRKKDLPIKISHIQQTGILTSIYRIKEKAIRQMRTYMQNPQLGVGVALAFGDRSFILPTVRQSFSRAGTAHILAISGLHIGIIAGIMLIFLRIPLLFSNIIHIPTNYYKITIATLIPAIWFFAILSGANTPVIRASIMITLFAISSLVGRKVSNWRVLVYAAIIILILFPESAFEASFYLSFAAVAGIIASLPAIFYINSKIKQSNINTAIKKIILYVLPTIFISTAAFVSTSPIIYSQFRQFNPLSVINNIVIVPYASVIVVPLAFLSGIFALFSLPFYQDIFFILQKSIDILIATNNSVSSIMNYDLGPYFSPITIGIFYAGAIYLLLGIYKVSKYISIPIAIGSFVALIIWLMPYKTPKNGAYIIPYTGENISLLHITKAKNATVLTNKTNDFIKQTITKTAYSFGIMHQNIIYKKLNCSDTFEVGGINISTLTENCRYPNKNSDVFVVHPRSHINCYKLKGKTVIFTGKNIPKRLQHCKIKTMLTGKQGAIICTSNGCKPFFENY